MKRINSTFLVFSIIAAIIALTFVWRTFSTSSQIAVTGTWITSLIVTNDHCRIIGGSMGPNLTIVTLGNRTVQILPCEPDTMAGIVVENETGVVWACSRTGRLFSWAPDAVTANREIDLAVNGAWEMRDWNGHLVIYCHDILKPFERGNILLVNTRTKAVASFDAPHDGGLESMVVIGDRLISAGKKDGSIVVSRLDDNMSIANTAAGVGNVAHLDWHDGDRMIVCFKNGMIEIRDTVTLSKVPGSYRSIEDAYGTSFSPDGRKLFVYGRGTLDMIDLKSERQEAVSRLYNERLKPINAAVGMDGYVIISRGETLSRLNIP